MKKYFRSIILIFLLAIILLPIKTNAATRTSFHLEKPTNNQTLNQELVISGWLMTESNNPKIHMYIDNKEITPTINRVDRRDVIKAYPTYSKNTNNQKPGFNAKVNTSEYSNGKHILTINVLDYEKSEVLSQYSLVFYIDKYKTKFNLEGPKANSKQTTSMNVGGWLMTESNNPTIHIYIDNEEVTSTINRVNRPDVLKAFPNYSKNNNNQKPGFSTTIDTSKVVDGKHTLTVNVLDDEKNEVINEHSINFYIEKSKSILHIENPNNNINTKKSITISGWLMSTNKNAKIEYYINNEKIDASITRSKRPDVIKAITGYGNSTTNPNPGFKTELDLSSYKDGNYKLEVRIIDSSNNEILTRDNRNIILKKYNGHVHIEKPKDSEELGTTTILGGWYLSEYKDSKLEVYIDNQLLDTEITKTERPDVIKAMGNNYGGSTTNKTPGFKTTLDTSNINDGVHTLKIKVVNPKTNEVITEGSKQIRLNKNKTTIYIEGPKGTQKSDIKIGGWYLSLNTNNTLKVFIDGKEINSTINRVERPDVIKAITGYGGSDINPKPGFSTEYNLKNYKDGNHTITIKVLDKKTNQVIGEGSTTITLKKYDGIIHIESPTTNKLVNRNMKIGGWSLSTDTEDSIRILIDNKQENVTITRTKREDVIKAISGYGGSKTNPTPGFGGQVNLTNYKDGNHTLTVQIIDNNTNDIISETSTNFKLKKYDGKINIDIPQTSMLNQSSLVIAGWEMSELDNSYLEIYIDDVKQDVEIARFEREDVINAITEFGNAKVNATPGFNTTLDISNLSLGKHRLKIKLYSKLNEQITETIKDLVKYNDVYFGIDVSYYNGTIDWDAVHKDGISFAMIRTGYRGYSVGGIVEDDKFKENITNALKNNISCGVYFYSQAITEKEAVEEADYTINKLKKYGVIDKLKLPIAIDTEFTDYHIGRADKLTQAQRTKVVKAFCQRIKEKGYTPIIYASRDFLYFNLNMSELSEYDVWLAHYTSTSDPMNHPSNYSGAYKIWQYTSTGAVSGIKGNVDKNISYIKY